LEERDASKVLIDTAENPHLELSAQQKEGRRCIGYLCSYVPEELIAAAGFIPVRVMLGPEPGETAGRYMQSFCCSFARSLLEAIGNGTYDYLKALVVPHTCDTIRNLSDILTSAGLDIEIIPLMVPTVTDTPEAVDFMTEELAALKSTLGELAGRDISDDDLWKAIAVSNRCRAALAGIKESGAGPVLLFASYLACQQSDRERFLQLAEQVVVAEGSEDGEPVALVGGPIPQTGLFSLLDECGLSVVWDDICTASRYAEGIVAEQGEPLRALAERYLGKTPCPTKTDLSGRREASVVEGAKASGAAGVIFVLPDFCEFHAFDYPDLKAALDAEGIPTLDLKQEHPFRRTGQAQTRLQAFAEILKDR
jgi:benzoyl-CoA reductase/2-hydroxyglutaryl-CoA dehydratase subunit BcrC/BadD/HgdB